LIKGFPTTTRTTTTTTKQNVDPAVYYVYSRVKHSYPKGVDVDSTCCEYENGTALHIAAANLGVSATKTLLNFGADTSLTDDLARRPVDCIPEMHSIDVTLPIDDVEEMVDRLKNLLSKVIKQLILNSLAL
jgi:hypothetical protein